MTIEALRCAGGVHLEESLLQLKADLKLLEETTLTKQTSSYRQRIRKANLQRYQAQTSNDQIDTMKVRHFPYT